MAELISLLPGESLGNVRLMTVLTLFVALMQSPHVPLAGVGVAWRVALLRAGHEDLGRGLDALTLGSTEGILMEFSEEV